MEHTGNIMQYDNRLISSILKMFLMFEIRLSYGDKDLNTISLNCINCKKETGLDPETSFTWVYVVVCYRSPDQEGMPRLWGGVG